jgi:hypothetical protein
MRRLILVTVIVATCIALFAAPVEAKTHKPAGVTTGQWVDYCNHSSDLVIALNGIADAGSDTSTVYTDMLLTAAVDFHHDAAKIRPNNAAVAKHIQSLSDAVSKFRTSYRKLRGLQIAADPLPDCV